MTKVHYGTIQLVDYRDRTIATIALAGRNPERELHSAVARWREFGAEGGYARDESGNMLAYC
jgi:hypothetical protein